MILTDSPPPNDRGCRRCGKIGHFVNECPLLRYHQPNSLCWVQVMTVLFYLTDTDLNPGHRGAKADTYAAQSPCDLIKLMLMKTMITTICIYIIMSLKLCCICLLITFSLKRFICFGKQKGKTTGSSWSRRRRRWGRRAGEKWCQTHSSSNDQ